MTDQMAQVCQMVLVSCQEYSFACMKKKNIVGLEETTNLSCIND